MKGSDTQPTTYPTSQTNCSKGQSPLPTSRLAVSPAVSPSLHRQGESLCLQCLSGQCWRRSREATRLGLSSLRFSSRFFWCFGLSAGQHQQTKEGNRTKLKGFSLHQSASCWFVGTQNVGHPGLVGPFP